MLVLLSDLMLHIFLYPPQHKWLQDGMQTLYLNLIKFLLVLAVCLDIFRKPLVKKLVRVEQVGHDEVE